MSNDNIITSDMMSAMLSAMSVDAVASIVAKAALGPDCKLPMSAVCSLLDMSCTIATMINPNERAGIVTKLRDISDILERDLLR